MGERGPNRSFTENLGNKKTGPRFNSKPREKTGQEPAWRRGRVIYGVEWRRWKRGRVVMLSGGTGGRQGYVWC